MHADLNSLIHYWNKVCEQGAPGIIFVILLLGFGYTIYKYGKQFFDAYKGLTGAFAEEREKAAQEHNLTIKSLSESHAKHIAELEQDIKAQAAISNQLRIDLNAAEENVTSASQVTSDVQRKLAWVKQRYRSAVKERIWFEPPRNGVPDFLPLSEFKTPIISVFNLKGGVGKTTISANLAATYWARGEKVLLIDLDYQASLTTQCLTGQQIYDLDFLKKVRCVLQLPAMKLAHSANATTGGIGLASDDDKAAEGWNELFDSMLLQVGSGKSYILPTSSELDAIEQQQLIELVFGQNDVRFNLRRVLHSPSLINRFDRIIIDCPPRLTSGSVNALASSHFVVIPVLADVLSTKAAPLLIKRLDEFRKRGICPNLKLLGVVANKTQNANGFSTRQSNRWEELRGWLPNHHLFESFIPERVAAGSTDPASEYAVPASLKTHFEKLADEIDQRINAHASL